MIWIAFASIVFNVVLLICISLLIYCLLESFK